MAEYTVYMISGRSMVAHFYYDLRSSKRVTIDQCKGVARGVGVLIFFNLFPFSFVQPHSHLSTPIKKETGRGGIHPLNLNPPLDLDHQIYILDPSSRFISGIRRILLFYRPTLDIYSVLKNEVNYQIK